MKHKSKSELEILLEKNAYGVGLNSIEKEKALKLIGNPIHKKENCWVCKISNPDDIEKAIYDTGLCQSHAYYALVTRK